MRLCIGRQICHWFGLGCYMRRLLRKYVRSSRKQRHFLYCVSHRHNINSRKRDLYGNCRWGLCLRRKGQKLELRLSGWVSPCWHWLSCDLHSLRSRHVLSCGRFGLLLALSDRLKLYSCPKHVHSYATVYVYWFGIILIVQLHTSRAVCVGHRVSCNMRGVPSNDLLARP